MKFTIKNVGPIKTATVEMGKLTVVCGKNNTGKTFLTRSVYEFYRTFRNNLSFSVELEQQTFPLDIDLSQYTEKAASAIKECAKKYSKAILENGGELRVSIKPSEFPVFCDAPPSQWGMGNRLFKVNKEGCILHIEEKIIPIDSTKDNNRKDEKDEFDFQSLISAIIKHYLFEQKYNDCFIADSFCVMSERVGFVHFKTHINIANAFVANQPKNDNAPINIKSEEEQLSNRKLLPLSLSIIHSLSIFEREKMFEDRKQTDYQKQFNALLDSVVEGKYELNEGQFFFTPNDANNNALSMDRSSSSVESLLLMDYYVRYFSEKGDVLVIDEPELNLHPEKQRQLAHLLGALVNAGIKVFITTHSDYIIRELNLMIQLKQDKKHFKAIRKEEGYLDSYLLDADDVKAYTSKKDNGSVTFKNVKVCQKKGMVISTLDEVINKMNTIQEAISWGE